MTAFNVMDVQPNWLLFCRVGTAALACIVVTFQNVLANIVFVVHLAKLIVCPYRQRLSFKHRFQALCVKFCGFHSYKSDRQNSADTLNNSNMLLNLYFY